MSDLNTVSQLCGALTWKLVVHRNHQLCASQLIPSWLFCKLCAQKAAHWVTWECESREPKALLGNTTIFPNQTSRLGSIISHKFVSDHVKVQGEDTCRKLAKTRQKTRGESVYKNNLMCTLKAACTSYECMSVACASESVQDTKRNLVCAEHRR